MGRIFLLVLVLLFTVRFVGAMEEGYCRDNDELWIKYNKLRTSKLCDDGKAVKEFIKEMDEKERDELWGLLNRRAYHEKYQSVEGFYAVLLANKDRVFENVYGWNESILHWLIIRHCDNRLNSIMLLVAVGANCNVERSKIPDIRTYITCDKKIALHLACEYGYFDIVKLLMWGGANKRAQDVNGYTPMHEYQHHYLTWHSKGRVDNKVKEMNQFLAYEKWWNEEGQHLQQQRRQGGNGAQIGGWSWCSTF